MPLSISDVVIKNRLLAALPRRDYNRLRPHLETVLLPINKILYEPNEIIRYAYFCNDAVVSLVSIFTDRRSVEVGLIGNEGMAGIQIILGGATPRTRAVVQIADGAERITAKALKTEFDRGGALHDILLRYVLSLFTQVSQTAACNRTHRLEARLARWLLMVHDRVDSDEFRLTQELISQMLGTTRPEVTIAAILLQRDGLIRYSRGRMRIIDRSGLESAACECYLIGTAF
ncbi:MAG TPA: Crp/Fnr family transcriptional regulator [Blastocatellia bacterium]|nr:Crp/Fnr family transcriptional regulator [Blastocatellia bacterium]